MWSIVRFLIGSSLLMTGGVLIASAAITVVGLPLGLVVFAFGWELLVGQSSRAVASRKEA